MQSASHGIIQKPQCCSVTVYSLHLRWRTLLQTFSGRLGSSTRTPSWWGRWTTPESGSTRGNSSKPFTSTYCPCTRVSHVSLQLRLLCDGTTSWALNCLTPVVQGNSNGATDEALFLKDSFISVSLLLIMILVFGQDCGYRLCVGGVYFLYRVVFSLLWHTHQIFEWGFMSWMKYFEHSVGGCPDPQCLVSTGD